MTHKAESPFQFASADLQAMRGLDPRLLADIGVPPVTRQKVLARQGGWISKWKGLGAFGAGRL